MSNTNTAVKNSESKPNSQYSPTIRLKVDLFEPTESRCPVFNYQKLLIEEKKRRKRDYQSNSVEENDESIKLAEHFEQKYGTSGIKKKKKKKTTFYNYSELAHGYDESDSFIDNTETFNDVMSEKVETEHGGYYVNTGELLFKDIYLSDDSEEIKSSHPRKPFRNAVLEDSDEKLPNFAVTNNLERNSLKETKTSETSNNLSSSSDEDIDSLKPCSSTPAVNGSTKRKQSVDSDSASSIIPIKKKKISTVVKLPIQEKKNQTPDCKPSCSKNIQSLSSEETPLTEINVSSISDTIESVISESFSKPSNVLLNPENDVVKTDQSLISIPNNIDLPVSNGVHNTVEILPEIITDIIESIKTEAQVATQNDLSVFSEQINLYLLSLEYQKELISFDSEPIYSTLAEYMSCDKEELVNHVNKLFESEETKIIEFVERLKTAIKKVMPSVIEQYNLECNKIIGLRIVNGTSTDGLKSKPGPKRPRRKFPWNEEFRTHIREIIHIRTALYSKLKRAQPVDLFIEKFINSQIKPLWPNGWMKSTIILRELKVKEKDNRPKLSKKQPLPNSPSKIITAIKMASEHKVSNSAMNKVHKWNKQKSSKVPDTCTTGKASVSTSHSSSPTQTVTPTFKQVYNSHSMAFSTLSNDVFPYQATITTTAINGCKQKESEKNSVIIKSEVSAEDILDLSPNKSNLIPFAPQKSKDVSVICNTPPDNSPTKTDLYVNQKHIIHQPISRKQRLLQEHNTPSSDQQKLSIHALSIEQASTKSKDDKSISQSNKLDSIKMDDKSTAKDIMCQIINESLMDNTSPLPSQFTTNNLYKTKEETKLPASTLTKQDIKNEYDWQHTSRTSSNHRSSSAELVEIQTQEVIRDLQVLNQLSSSCSSRSKKDCSIFKKHSSSVSMYSSHLTDTLVNSPLGVIHHPAYRNSFSTSSSTKPKNESTHGTTLGIPKMSIGLQDEFLKHMVKSEEPRSPTTSDSYQKRGITQYGIIKSNAQFSDNLYHPQFYSTLNKQPNQDMSHNSEAYKNTND